MHCMLFLDTEKMHVSVAITKNNHTYSFIQVFPSDNTYNG